MVNNFWCVTEAKQSAFSDQHFSTQFGSKAKLSQMISCFFFIVVMNCINHVSMWLNLNQWNIYIRNFLMSSKKKEKFLAHFFAKNFFLTI